MPKRRNNNVLIRSGEALAIGWSRNMLYSGFSTLPRSVFWSANCVRRSDNTDVIQLMRTKLKIYSICLLLLVGCNGQHGESQVRTQPSTDTQPEVRYSEDELGEVQREIELALGPKLPALAPVDNLTREHNGIVIQGSALTDAHVSAIGKITGLYQPESSLGSITLLHSGPNKCRRILKFDGGDSTVHLEFVDNRWTVRSSTDMVMCKFGEE